MRFSSWNTRRAISSIFASARTLDMFSGRRDANTGDAVAVNIVQNSSLELRDRVEPGSGAVDEGREAGALEEGEGKRQLVDLIGDGAAYLDDRELDGLVGVRGDGEDAEVELDVTLRDDKVQQACDGMLYAKT
jgi:hypothetical protein